MKSILARLLLVVSLALLPVLGFQIYEEFKARNVRHQMMQDEALRFLRLVVSEQQRIFEGAEETLTAISGAPDIEDKDPDRCSRLLANLLQKKLRYDFAGVLDLDGHLVCASGPFDRSLDLTIRPYFRRALQTGGFVTGDYSVGLISKEPTLHMAQPLRNQDGAITGVIVVGLRLSWLRQQLEHLGLPGGISAAIMDRNGIALARTPDGERYVGQPLSAENRIMLGDTTVQIRMLTGRDGRPRVIASSPPSVDQMGLLITVGLDRDVIFAEVTRANDTSLVLLIGSAAWALAMTILLGAYMVKRPLDRLLVVADRWRNGDLSTRTGLPHGGSEFGRLADSFDAMAEALANREQTLRTALETTTDSVVVLDRDWHYVYLNQHAVDQTAGGRNLLGQVFWDCFPTAADSAFGKAYREAVESGRPTHVEDYFAPVDTRFDVYAYPSAEGLTIYFRDVTEQRRTEAALRVEMNRAAEILEARVAARTADLARANQAFASSNKELESFSYSVSHDLRAPLRAIEGFSAILLEDYTDKLDDDGRRMLGLVRQGSVKMARLIDDILEFSRAGRAAMMMVVLDMNALVQFALADLAPAIEGRALELRIATLPAAFGDAHTIQRVWMNLLDNAIKYTGPRQPAIVEVGAREIDGEMVYFVKDNGVGFDMRYAGKLFGLFQRLHSPEQFPGTGCGLAIVDRIISRNGGRLWAEGQLDQGATFYFVLPSTKVNYEPSFT